MGEAVVVVVELLLGAATVLGILWLALPRVRPWRVLTDSVARTLRSGRRTAWLALCLAVLASDCLYLSLKLDERATAWVVARRGEDFTSLIHRHIEADAVARIQATVAWLPLTYLFGFLYIVGFSSLICAAVLVFDHLRDRRGLALVLAALVLNYVAVFPFYVAFPVREAFVYYQETATAGPGARLLLDDISPLIMRAYRATSGVDNCFPSFHTSLTVTLALAAWHGGRRFGGLMTALAVPTVLSTVYLGIHWLTDVAAGLVMGVVVYGLSRTLTRRWEGEGG